jgi:hypothetical protein
MSSLGSLVYPFKCPHVGCNKILIKKDTAFYHFKKHDTPIEMIKKLFKEHQNQTRSLTVSIYDP